MADIRHTDVFEDYAGYPASPVETTYEPTPSAVLPWYTQAAALPVRISSGGMGGSEFPPSSCLGFYSSRLFGVTGSCEIWGYNVGDPALSDYWRIGLFTWDTCRSQFPSGYQALLGFGIGGVDWVLREYTNGDVNNIASNPASDHAGICYMSVRGTTVEVWFSNDGGANWTLRMSAVGSHAGPFYACFGTTGVETGWGHLGGGEINRQHIYRWLRAP